MVLELQASSTMVSLDIVVVMCLRTVVFSSYFGLAEWMVLPLAVHFSSSCWLSWLLWCC
jgi:hypothetical protein